VLTEKKLSTDAKNNTAVASAGGNTVTISIKKSEKDKIKTKGGRMLSGFGFTP